MTTTIEQTKTLCDAFNATVAWRPLGSTCGGRPVAVVFAHGCAFADHVSIQPEGVIGHHAVCVLSVAMPGAARPRPAESASGCAR